MSRKQMESQAQTPEPEQVFNRGIELHHYANTAYPLNGVRVWKDFRVKNSAIDSAVESAWKDVNELGLYVHIPFCDKRCMYCEYAVLSGEEAEQKEDYIELVLSEIAKYREIFGGSSKTAVGLDIGGGTPTLAPAGSLERVVAAVLGGYTLAGTFGMSIETTPIIAADLQKLRDIRSLGIERISMGVQTINPQLLRSVGRANNTARIIQQSVHNIREAGFNKFNIDIMYGLPRQTVESFLATAEFVARLGPDYITLYRTRLKGTRLEHETRLVTLDQVNAQYAAAFGLLTASGYDANLGKNTFSKVNGDPGTSAYLTRRVIDGLPYLGMGLAAQSLADGALYYNDGAASKQMVQYRKQVLGGHFPVQDLYLLPPEEIMAKMISVSFYFGYINKDAFQRKFGVRLEDQFPDEVDFLVGKGLMKHSGQLFQLTNEGKDAINGAIPLFYSSGSKRNIMT